MNRINKQASASHQITDDNPLKMDLSRIQACDALAMSKRRTTASRRPGGNPSAKLLNSNA